MRKKTQLIILFIISPYIFLSQISTSNSNNYGIIEYLVNNVLLGNGVTATNITYIGDTNQRGFFSGINSNIGLDSGVVLSSGSVLNISTSTNLSTDFTTTASDPDLITIAKSVTSNPQANLISSVFDLSVLEFDFIPQGNSISFNYVFGSDEYLTYINTQFNDIFAFLISGPGITGPYASPAGFPGGAKNIAMIPGTTTPVTISSVQPGLNNQYYVQNNNQSNTNHFLNGFTTVLQAFSDVTCGMTYHIKLAIADCEDKALDSDVFLESGSFKSNANISVSSNLIENPNIDIDSAVLEGCGDVIFKIKRPSSLGTMTIIFDMIGSAIEGIDYAPIVDSVVLLNGEDSIEIHASAYMDYIQESTDTVILRIHTIKDTCTILDGLDIRAYFYILDNHFTYDKKSDTIECPGDSAYIEVSNIVFPNGLYKLWWYNTEISNSIYVNPTETTNYAFYLQDTCEQYILVDSIEVVVKEYDKLKIKSLDTIICYNDSIVVTNEVSGGLNPIYITYNTINSDTELIIIAKNSQEIVVSATDFCNNKAYDTSFITVSTPNADFNYKMNDPMTADFIYKYIDNDIDSFDWYFDINNIHKTGYKSNHEFIPNSYQYTATLKVKDKYGCIDSITKILNPLVEYVIPNIVTPNFDNINDILEINFYGVYDLNFNLFNRWGELIFHSNNPNIIWDCTYKGKLVNEGVYGYTIEYYDIDQEKHIDYGHITIIK